MAGSSVSDAEVGAKTQVKGTNVNTAKLGSYCTLQGSKINHCTLDKQVTLKGCNISHGQIGAKTTARAANVQSAKIGDITGGNILKDATVGSSTKLTQCEINGHVGSRVQLDHCDVLDTTVPSETVAEWKIFDSEHPQAISKQKQLFNLPGRHVSTINGSTTFDGDLNIKYRKLHTGNSNICNSNPCNFENLNFTADNFKSGRVRSGDCGHDFIDRF